MYTAKRIEVLEDLLVETMNEVNPPMTRCEKKQEKDDTTQIRQKERQRVLQRLRNSALDVLSRGKDAEAEVGSYLEAMRITGQEMVAPEGSAGLHKQATTQQTCGRRTLHNCGNGERACSHHRNEASHSGYSTARETCSAVHASWERSREQ